jgi:hydroxymethylpyrimidine pyrophosphatase-like HAD family hydrolase
VRYHALASDYDGTLATDGTILEPTRAALVRLRASGRKLLLVTGRRLEDLERVCPDLTLFDSIVAENGAVLFRPASRELRLLAEPPAPAFAAALRARGVEPLDVGHVIVATWQPHEGAVLDAIRAQGLELQVVFNKGAVMVLPSGVNKATGLEAALLELGLSPHNVVGTGDAENDHAFLAHCELGVAVANAIASLKAEADHVARGERGAGVVELIDALLADDLRSTPPRAGRHDIPLGEDEAGRPITIAGCGTTLLCAGVSGGGKSALVAGVVERLVEQRYQYCIVDPEGDYIGRENAVVLGDASRAPTVDEVMDALLAPDRNVVVCLLGLPIDGRPPFWTALLPRLLDLRTRFGRPHWIVIDESHHLFPEGWQMASPGALRDLRGLVLITVHPEHLARPLLGEVDALLAVGGAPSETLAAFAAALGQPAPPVDRRALQAGEVLLWRPGDGGRPLRIRARPGRAERRRHARKYAEGELGPDKSFFFRGPDGRLNLRAQNLRLFLQVADGVDDATWFHHLRQGDYSRWIRDAIKDDALADSVAAVEHRASAPADEPRLAQQTRAAVRAAVESRYTAPA